MNGNRICKKKESCCWHIFSCQGNPCRCSIFRRGLPPAGLHVRLVSTCSALWVSNSRLANAKWSSVEWHVNEGETLTPTTHCATVKGPVRKILLGERVALNILARCSGIATKYSFSASPLSPSSITLFFVTAESVVDLSLRFQVVTGATPPAFSRLPGHSCRYAQDNTRFPTCGKIWDADRRLRPASPRPQRHDHAQRQPHLVLGLDFTRSLGSTLCLWLFYQDWSRMPVFQSGARGHWSRRGCCHAGQFPGWRSGPGPAENKGEGAGKELSGGSKRWSDRGEPERMGKMCSGCY